jgi:hypothetical protein
VLIGLIPDKVLFSPWERFLHRRRGIGLKYPALLALGICPPSFLF